MKNLWLITLFQNFPAWTRRQYYRYWGISSENADVSNPSFLQNIRDDLPKGVNPRNALIALRPDVWVSAKRQHPNIKIYNIYGFLFSLVKALNETGYEVDILDPQAPAITLPKRYDLFICHGGYGQWILDQIPPQAFVYQYISGLYWKAFDEESDARYEHFYSSRRLEKPKKHRRSITDQMEGLEALNRQADKLFSVHCPRMVAGYGPYASKFYFTGLGAYLDKLFIIPESEKDFEAGRYNFIYVGGTSGNIQKGLDLLLETFSRTPHLHLYIYCKVEDEIYRHCRKELGCPNIHYIYHWRFRLWHSRLKSLLCRTNFTVHAPINTGTGTAFSASFGSGLIPVGYTDVPDPSEYDVLADSWHVDALVECIQRAADKPADWCRKASRLARAKYAKHCDPVQVENNFREMFKAIPHSSAKR